MKYDIFINPVYRSDFFELIDQFSWNKRSYLNFPINDIKTFQLSYQSENKLIVQIINDSLEMIFPQKYATESDTKNIFLKTLLFAEL